MSVVERSSGDKSKHTMTSRARETLRSGPQCGLSRHSTLCSVLCALIAMMSAIGVPIQAQAGPGSGSVALLVQEVKLERLLADHAELSAVVVVTPGTAATLQQIRFQGFSLDTNTPVFIQPMAGRFVLQRGVPLVLPRAQVTAYYADFPTPAAMDDMLKAHKVRVVGEVRADLQLSLLGKLAVRESNPVAGVAIDQSVPFDEDAVSTSTQLGIGLLSLAQTALGTSASVLNRIAGVRVTVESGAVSTRILQSMVAVRTTYKLQGKPESAEKVCVRLGFRVDNSHLLVPLEVLEPWAFSLETSAALASGMVQLDKASVDTVVVPFLAAGGSSAQGLSQARGEFTVSYRGHPFSSRLVLPGGGIVKVLEREDGQNFALLHLDQLSAAAMARASDDMAGGTLSVLRRSVQEDGTLHRLDLGTGTPHNATGLPRPVDETAFGSPLSNAEGVLGMVVGERTVVPLTALPVGNANGQAHHATSVETVGGV